MVFRNHIVCSLEEIHQHRPMCEPASTQFGLGGCLLTTAGIGDKEPPRMLGKLLDS